jgi:hypothetical protein
MDVQAGRISVELGTEVPAQRQQLATKHQSQLGYNCISFCLNIN